MTKLSFFTFLALFLAFSSCQQQAPTVTKTDILIIGGGTSGTAAALQAARMGAEVLVAEETSWLGGMLTAAAVSATDGNHNLPSGIWGEFRQKLYDHYGSPQALTTGWVSNTQFEPSVGDSIFKAMVAAESNIKVLFKHRLLSLNLNDKGFIISATFINEADNSTVTIEANIVIDATELGDAVGIAGVPHRIGQDAVSLTNEPMAPQEASPYIQDLTYCAILKDYGAQGAPKIAQPANYDPAEFNCSCKESCDDPESKVVSCTSMLDYARLPNGNYLINWPTKGNDHYVNPIELSHEERVKAYQEAKETTLRFVYHIQQTLGFSHLGISNEEFPTEDGFPLIPYHRESRRIIGKAFLTALDLKDPYRNTLYQQAIAVGDYPVDHHHKKNPLVTSEFTPETDFPIPSFSVPLGSLIPENATNLIAAEKSISVSHLANGSTRLQPVVLGIGQAAGALAALAVKNNTTIDSVHVREVQSELLNAGAYLLPFFDCKPNQPGFRELQALGVKGLLKGHGVPYQWANQTYIYPDSAITMEILKTTGNSLSIDSTTIPDLISRQAVLTYLFGETSSYTPELTQKLTELAWWSNEGLTNAPTVTRREWAILLNERFDLMSH